MTALAFPEPRVELGVRVRPVADGEQYPPAGRVLVVRARRGGWNVAVGYDPPAGPDFARETVGFADRSHMPKLELHAPIVDFRGGVAKRRDGAWWCPVTPARTLILGEPGDALPEAATVVDVTCGLAALSLIGPSAGELLARFCAVDVRDKVTPVGGFRPGSVARTHGYVLREADDRLLVIVGWSLREYMWEVEADATKNLGGVPYGAYASAVPPRADVEPSRGAGRRFTTS